MSPHRTWPIRNVVVDLVSNSIALFPGEQVEETVHEAREVLAVLDMGQSGALIGIEIGEDYFPVSSSGAATDDLVRSVDVHVSVSRSADGVVQRVRLPRTGDRYEIAFPIGNQCWRQHVNGTVTETCVITLGRQ
jgi:hypothetical protein